MFVLPVILLLIFGSLDQHYRVLPKEHDDVKAAMRAELLKEITDEQDRDEAGSPE